MQRALLLPKKAVMDKSMIKTFPVTGLSCANCALNVEKALKRQPGVLNATVNFADTSALVEMIPGSTDAATLQSAVRSIGYDLLIEENGKEQQAAAQQTHYRVLRSKVLWSLALAAPVMVISMFFMNMPFANLIMLAFTLPVLAWFGRGFFINALKLARHGQSNMDTLVALSTGIAFIFSVFNTFYPQFWHSRGLHPHVYYEASAVVIAFILLGKLLEEKAKSNTSSAIKKLMGLQPNMVTLVGETADTEVPIARVKPGDHLRIKPGDMIPVDGEVFSGSSFVDESTMTGEPLPVEKQPGDKVYSGTLNRDGSFVLVARQVGSETLLSKIIEMVRKAQGSKAPVQKTVDKVAGIFVPVVITVSLLSFVAWMLVGGSNGITQALTAMVTVLVIACPCALGLATPTAIMVGMGKGAQQGILIRDAESLERIRKITAVVMDKTGTITEGKPEVTEILWMLPDEEIIVVEPILMALEMHSAHPLAEAVTAFLSTQGNQLISLAGFENLSGKGVKANVGDIAYAAGNLKLMDETGVQISATSAEKINQFQEAGSVVCFSAGSRLLAIIALADPVKPSSRQAIQELQQLGIEVYMLTGDNAHTAEVVARNTGISHFSANLLPADKAAYISELQKQGKVVAMAGDGINDSQALAEADVSIAMGRGSDIAMDVAGMTLVSSDLRQIVKAFRLSAMTVSTIHQNLFWAFIYNLIGIPVAAGVLYPLWGIMLNPMIAAAAMALSSVSVVSNSLRLRTKKL